MVEPTGHCPYLGLKQNQAIRFASPTTEHRCYAAGQAQEIPTFEANYQTSYCLSPNHIKCPLYTGSGLPSTPLPAPQLEPALVSGGGVRGWFSGLAPRDRAIYGLLVGLLALILLFYAIAGIGLARGGLLFSGEPPAATAGPSAEPGQLPASAPSPSPERPPEMPTEAATATTEPTPSLTPTRRATATVRPTQRPTQRPTRTPAPSPTSTATEAPLPTIESITSTPTIFVPPPPPTRTFTPLPTNTPSDLVPLPEDTPAPTVEPSATSDVTPEQPPSEVPTPEAPTAEPTPLPVTDTPGPTPEPARTP